MPQPKNKSDNQFQLLTQKRFGPYFVTQFLGALNDNIYRYALLALIGLTIATQNKSLADFWANLGACLFILPFFIFSALAGQFADKYDKAKLIRIIKFAEIVIMSCVGLGFYFDNMILLMVILFAMGTQSAFFGPVKFSILPQYLNDKEIIGGNGLVEMGTFIAILFGMIIGVLVISIENTGPLYLGIVTVITACLGWITSLFIPQHAKKGLAPDLNIKWNIISESWHILKIGAKKRTLFLSILGISWFWYYGITFLTQLPNYNTLYLKGDEYVITLLLATSSLGIGIGSMLCERLSGHKVEMGLVPFGAIGLTLFAFDLSFAHGPIPLTPIGIIDFFTSFHNIHILIDLFCMGLFGGFYIVPLYVILQTRSHPRLRSRVIAANNIMNALFMALGSASTILLLHFGLSIPQLFLVLAIMTFIVMLFIFSLLPEFLLRFIVWLLVHSFYRVKMEGLDNIPEKGPAVITSNHVSFLDPLIIMAATRRPIRFVMDYYIFKVPLVSLFFKMANCIPIATHRENPTIKAQAFEKVEKALSKGELIGIFPEGGLTNNGDIKPFKPGIDTVINKTPVPVIPMAIQGLWGSFFSRRYGRAMLQIPRRFFWAKINLTVGKPIPAKDFSSRKLEHQIKTLHNHSAQ